MLAHGVAGFLKERMFEASDGYRIHVCEMCVRGRVHFLAFSAGTDSTLCALCSCGLTAIANLKKQSFECRACKNRTASAFGFVLARLLPRRKLTLSPALQLRKCTFLTRRKYVCPRHPACFVRLLMSSLHQLLFSELQAMNVACRIGFEDRAQENSARQSTVV